MEIVDDEHSDGVVQIRGVIENFIQERLQLKLDKLKEGDEQKRQQLLDAYIPQTWIADAARRVTQIQQVTHALKYIHPDAKGTNLSMPGNPESGALLVGTHTLEEQYSPDVVGNAAALDVYKFLRLEVNKKSLLARAIENDLSLSKALSDYSDQAKEWMESFASLARSKGKPASHKLAKQLYWPLEDGHYHLLAPLFPTSLVHKVWTTIREDRFSDVAKAAREARRNNEECSCGYREYPNLVLQKFGGTKPQNISQLNSERYGENQLLPSFPPVWRSESIKPPLRVESIFDGWFSRRYRVRELTKILRNYLYKVQDQNNMHVRKKRIELVGYIVDELLLFAAEIRELDESWTLHQECKLNMHEQCWLNPYRAQHDPDFSSMYMRGDWKEAICKRFANWLNARLVDPKKPLPFGEDTAHQWQSDFGNELGMLRLEVDSYE